ncbi:unnamed protein product, partial [Rotaria sp. Silwood1]
MSVTLAGLCLPRLQPLIIPEAVKHSTTNALTPEQKERLKREKQRFKYICCNQIVQASGMMSGCKRGKHSPANVTLIQWEYSCD